MTTEKPVGGLLEDFGTPDGPPPVAPPWHDADSDVCRHGWIIGGAEWGVCDCEDPSHPWPPRLPGDGPRDCQCFFCEGHKPRHERGKIAQCEHKDHHCADCHEHRRCTIAECGFQ
jgi:hypothetical protein